MVFERHGCTNDLCHGSSVQGGLDLRPGAAYANLVEAPAHTVPEWKRVYTGQKDRSLLWINLAAKTFPKQWEAPFRAMPPDALPALTAEELELIRLWIEVGAPKTGVVQGTTDLVDACLPPVEPIAIDPLPPPAPGTGVQIHMPLWKLGPQSEHEVCYASYYDVTDQVPPALRQPNGTFRYKSYESRQDPLSHHLIVNLYDGRASVTHPSWGAFRCRGGARDGETCDPLDLDFCGEGGGCSTDPQVSFACIGFGPGDGGFVFTSGGVLGTQETASTFDYNDGVYNELPMKGIIMWNTHGFNLTDKEGKLEGWLNFYFAEPEDQIRVQGIFDTNSIFSMNVPAFSTQELCQVHTMVPNAHLFFLTSHNHKHGKRFRIFEGAWRCQGGPNNGAACSPFGPDFDSPDLCAGAPCGSTGPTPFGDCNGNGSVEINELVSSVNIALERTSVDSCQDSDANGDEKVSISELVVSVNAALGKIPGPGPRNPQRSLLFLSLIYNDPVMKRFNPPRVYPSGTSPDQRSVTFCSLYDNGFTNPAEVKRKSTSPIPGGIGIGGPCATATHCTEGRVGQPCSGSGQAARDASCNTDAGNDGRCDACPLGGGETTEDEMFIMVGSYYVP